MGQQQLLLIALGVIVVGAAVVLGITYFQSHSVETKRNNIIVEGVNLATMAQQYYMKSLTMLGKSERTFDGWTVPEQLDTTSNGVFTAIVNTDNVVIKCVGNELVTSGVPVEVQVTVYPQSYSVTVVH